ncbi:S-adenosyl-L-methionine-dependent methyltransferase [Coniella lustricola]|uniref:Arsenite methyltransferase n=1 Tax=Coniella lustricola TaxID=2025994 RepID=A0A2T3AJW9_9PEZI|nr:S-adenosyl-L-methionine-dependent methyltransferase [Coniella lustricola]
MAAPTTQQIYSEVTERYSAASKGTSADYGHAVAKAFGYSEQELADTPKEANLGLSCGNPLVMASIRQGETVIDLGSGAGFDVFMAASKVGPTGKVIGVDMNKDMLARANEIKTRHGRDNVEFVEARITDMSSIPDNTADVIISNCVVNLVPEDDKLLVFKEMHRLLKPGGRVALSDILAKKPLPEKLRANMALYVGCVSGASLVEQYQQYLKEAGFSTESVIIKDDGADLNVYIETNPDGSRTIGGREGNLCCNPRTETVPAPAASGPCCSNGDAKPAEAVEPAKASSCCGPKKEAPAPAKSSCCGPKSDAAAPVAASSSCCGSESKAQDLCAFDESALADLEGEDLNAWAGKF